MTIKLEKIKADALRNPRVREAYDALGPQFSLARQFIEARAAVGLTQAELAARMGTTQSAIARLESGRYAPGLETMRRFAAALGLRYLTLDFAASRAGKSSRRGELRLRA